MGKEIFISYAARDPDWPAEKVKALADQLRAKGNNVHLDQDYQAAMGRKVSPAEWIGWMEQRIDTAALILCLCSPRYKQAQKRDLNDLWGFGVAAESLDMALRLYDRKQHNEGWIWLVFGENHERKEVIPGRLYGRCPEYVIPREEIELIKHASAGTDVNSSGGDTTRSEKLIVGTPVIPHLPHRRVTEAHISEAKSLWRYLNDSDLHNNMFPEESLKTPIHFVSWLDSGSVQNLELVMRIIRVAYGVCEQSEKDALATVSLYLLCACNLIDRAVFTNSYSSGEVLEIPNFGGRQEDINLYAALISTALGGGELKMVPNQDDARPMPAFTYGELDVTSGDNKEQLFEVALYNATFKSLKAAKVALKDDQLEDWEKDNLVERLKTIQGLPWLRKTITLVVRAQPSTFNNAPKLTRDLEIPVFVCSDNVSTAVVGMTTGRLLASLRELWKEVAAKYPAKGNEDVFKYYAQDITRDSLSRELADLSKAYPDEPALAALFEAMQSPEKAEKSVIDKGVEAVEKISKFTENGEKLVGLGSRIYIFLSGLF